MTHKFDHKNMNKLDNEWRRENLPPLVVLEKLGLSAEDTFADIGCGIGYFTLPASEIVKINSKVFALDTSEEMLVEVEKRVVRAEIKNVVGILTTEYDLKLPDQTVSFALLVNVLHEIEDKARFIKEIKRILKPSGKLAIIEWEKEQTQMGPSSNHRISEDDTIQILKAGGFSVSKQLKFTELFYGLVSMLN